MSFVTPGKKPVFRQTLREILAFRLHLLSKFNYFRIFELEDEEIKDFISEVRKNPGVHWKRLNDYITAAKHTKTELTLENIADIQIPSIRLDILIKLSTLPPAEKEAKLKQISVFSNRLLESLNLDQLVYHLQKDYFGQVEVSTYHIFSAVYATTLRLTITSEVKTLAYLKSWLRAQGNWESLQSLEARRYSSHNKVTIISLDARSSIERDYGELYGKSDDNLHSLEIAEREFEISTQLFSTIMKYTSRLETHLAEFDDARSHLSALRFAYAKKDYKTVHDRYDEFLECIIRPTRQMPLNIRRSLLPEIVQLTKLDS